MKTFVALILMGLFIDYLSSMTHTLRSFHTSSSQVPNFPVSVVTFEVNGVEIGYCDSETWCVEPKYKWMDRAREVDPDFWLKAMSVCVGNIQRGKYNLEAVKQLLNLTEGVHVLQDVLSCEWDDETGDVSGSVQYGLDGEDIASFELAKGSWVIAKPEVSTTLLGNLTSDYADGFFFTLFYGYREWLPIFVEYGKKTLLRTELPLVSLLQKSTSSPVTCHATGFFPDKAQMFWTQDGHELFEEVVDFGEILPNGDGTFQTSVNLDLSSVPPKDWDRYECVFRLSGVKDDLVTRLERDKIRTNAKSAIDLDLLIGLAVGVTITLTIILTVALLVIGRKKRSEEESRRSPEVPLASYT